MTGYRKVEVICSSFPGLIYGEILWWKKITPPRWISLQWRLAPCGRSFQTYLSVTDKVCSSFPAIFSQMHCVHPPAAWFAELLLMLKVCFSRAITASLEALPTCWNFKSGPYQSTPFLPLNCTPSTVWRWLFWVVAPDFCVERVEGWCSDCLRSWRTCNTTFFFLFF